MEDRAPGPVDVIMAFQDALNRGAVDDAAALFHDDKVGIILLPLWLPMGVRVRDVLDYSAGIGLTLELSGCKVEENSVNCQMLARDNACLTSIGIDPAHYPTARFKFLEGKIDLVTADIAPDEAIRWDAAEIQMENWLRLHFPDEIERLESPASTGTTPRQQGEPESKLCKAWAAANK